MLIVDVVTTAQNRLSRVQTSIRRLALLRDQSDAEEDALKVARQTAERATRLEATGRAAGAVAHDLNNALAGILGWSSFLEDEPSPTADDLREAATTFNEATRVPVLPH